MIQKLEAILFDMDGVLVDSEPVYLDFFRTFFVRNGKQADPERLKKTVGASHKKTWQLLAEMWSSDCEPEKLCELYHNTCADLVLSYQRAAVPGLQQTLALLQQKGLRLYIVSASALPSIQRMIAETGVGPYITDVVSGESVRRSKPDPDAYLQAMRLAQTDAEHCIAVEDSRYGFQAARAAGLHTAGVRSRLDPQAQAAADWPISSITELPGLLMRQKLIK